eukprot:scaffold7836_cov178-Amphora_coffeaeformis.AAC.2
MCAIWYVDSDARSRTEASSTVSKNSKGLKSTWACAAPPTAGTSDPRDMEMAINTSSSSSNPSVTNGMSSC